MSYTLLHAKNHDCLAVSNKMSHLFSLLDTYTRKQIPVVIVDNETGEIRGGNIMGMQITIDLNILKLPSGHVFTK